MSKWPSTQARRVLAALLRIGWAVKRQAGSHLTLALEVLKSDLVLLAKDFETIELEAQKIEAIIAEFEKKKSAEEPHHSA